MSAPRPTQPHVWELLQDVMVTQTVPGPISDELYINQFVSDLKKNTVRVIFSVAFGATSLTATQRKAAADVLRDKHILAIVVTDSRMTRGIITAVSWLGANAKAFGWDDVDLSKAVQATGASAELQARLTQIAKKFRTEHSASISE
jgi:hypothetical protein